MTQAVTPEKNVSKHILVAMVPLVHLYLKHDVLVYICRTPVAADVHAPQERRGSSNTTTLTFVLTSLPNCVAKKVNEAQWAAHTCGNRWTIRFNAICHKV